MGATVVSVSATGEATQLAPDRTVRRAVAAVYVAFIGSGVGFATWASRIPQVRDKLDVTPSRLGLILLCMAIGSIVAVPASGVVVASIGEARTVTAMCLVLSSGLAFVAIGYNVGVVPVGIGLFLVGFGIGAWDVAMNVQGAAVEQAVGRSIMSRFHAGYSVGTVAGAGVGAAMVGLQVPVTVHLLSVAVILGIAVPLAAMRGFLPHVVTEGGRESRRSAIAAWREPRTLLIGVFVLCMAFTEGAGNDWLGVAMIDGYHTSDTLGTLTLAVFLSAMTIGRWFGPALLDRYGRVPVLRTCAVTAFGGLLLVVFGHAFVVAVLGAALWGLGASLGFPTGMSAAADDPRRAAARVSVTASIAYVAFLAGPPFIGFVGDHIGVLHALTVVAGLLAAAALISGACTPLVVPEAE